MPFEQSFTAILSSDSTDIGGVSNGLGVIPDDIFCMPILGVDGGITENTESQGGVPVLDTVPIFWLAGIPTAATDGVTIVCNRDNTTARITLRSYSRVSDTESLAW